MRLRRFTLWDAANSYFPVVYEDAGRAAYRLIASVYCHRRGFGWKYEMRD